MGRKSFTGSAQYLLGIDSGLTVTKVVVFDTQGREIGSGKVRIQPNSPFPRWVERDMQTVWEACQQAICTALEEAGVTGEDIVAVGVTGHGDGLYLIDEYGSPVRPAILSLDTRAYEVVERWRQISVLDRALSLTGQQPYAAAPASLLAWLAQHEPETLAHARWVFSCKDWIRYKLTGEVATDPTEASVSFTDVRTQQYSSAAFELFGLADIEEKVPPIIGSATVAGTVTSQAAQLTGLRPGTPVVAGLHDVDACAIGTGCSQPGQLSMTAGTFSINQVISNEPILDARWACRNFIYPGQWMNMSISPASATNLDWFLRELCQAEVERAEQTGTSVFEVVNREVVAVMQEDSRVLFLPFIYGSPHGNQASACFFGLRGWHTRGHMLRAIFEGVAFNHKTHIDALRSAFMVTEVRVTGGGSRSETWNQIFADSFGLPVVTTEAQEAGALGTAICAGIGAGIYDSLEEAIGCTVRHVRTYEPDPRGQARLASAYQLYRELIQALEPVWSRVE